MTTAATPRLDEAMDFILDNVEDKIEVTELEKLAKAAGIASHTLKDARAVLKKQKKILIRSQGFGEDKKWMLYTANKN